MYCIRPLLNVIVNVSLCLIQGFSTKYIGYNTVKSAGYQYISDYNHYTVNFLNIRTPRKFVIITLKFELCGSTIE